MTATVHLSNQEIARLFDAAAETFDECSNLYTMHRRSEALAAEAEGRCLEIGGGAGAVSAKLADRLPVIHSDISSRMCRVARRKVGCPTVCFDAEAIPAASHSLDTLISSEMICYLNHIERFADESYRVLRPGGRLLICTTNPTITFLERGRTLLRQLGFKHMFFDDGSPPFIPLNDLTEVLERAGFAVQSTRKIVVLPFAFLDPLNHLLERTVLRHFGLFMIVVAEKRDRSNS